MNFRTYELIAVEITRNGPVPYSSRFYTDSADHAVSQWRQSIGDSLDQRPVCIRAGLDMPWHFVGAQ